MDSVVDIETLGTRPDCVILTVGAVWFDPYSDTEPTNPLYVRLEVDHQVNLGRTIDDDTMDWWSRQSPEIVQEALGDDDRITGEQFVQQFNRFLTGVDNVWAQGATFDFTILGFYYRMLGRPFPLNYWALKDSRTLFKMMPSDPRAGLNDAAHNALADAYTQAIAIQNTYRHFGVTKP